MRNKTVTLCGSARFEKEFHKINKYLTLRGIVVLSLACFPSQEKKKNWYNEEQKLLLDLVHFKKISQSDAIVVITQENKGEDVSKQEAYIGESTSTEITWATMHEVEVCYDYTRSYLGWGETFCNEYGNLLGDEDE